MSTLYEKSEWVEGPDGKPVLRRRPGWDLTQELTRHRADCRVSEEIRRSVGKGMEIDRRLALAQTAACTCGARDESLVEWWKPVSVDRRDNRDPVDVGVEYLAREDGPWQSRGNSSGSNGAGPTG